MSTPAPVNQHNYEIPLPDLTSAQKSALVWRTLSSLRVLAGAFVLMIVGGLLLSTFGLIVGAVSWYGVMLAGALNSGTLFNYSARHGRNLTDAELAEFIIALHQTRAYKKEHS
jgi:hypothetical protein